MKPYYRPARIPDFSSTIGLGAAFRFYRLWIPLLLLCTLPAVVQAQFLFYTNNGTATIIRYTGSGGAVTIPDTITGLPVTGIGEEAFQGQTSVTSVTIGTNVANIDEWAFRSCSSLSSITIPDNVTNIGQGAFDNCRSLINITIPSSVTSIGDSEFFYCSSLTNFTIGSNITSIGQWAFGFCTSLSSATIPDNVTNIGQAAFGGCTNVTAITVGALNSVYASVDGVLFNKNLTTLVAYPAGKAGRYYAIPNSVINVGDWAFSFCRGLTNVEIPNSVTTIGPSALSACTALTAITVDALNSVYASVDGFLLNKSRTTLIQCPEGKSGSINVPASVTTIGGGAFAGCSGIRNLTMPESLISIESGGLSGCHGVAIYFTGNAPTAASTDFSNPDSVIVYYLPGTTDWMPAFSGAPTFLWNPQPTDFRIQSTGFAFTITGNYMIVVVEACTNLANPIWLPVSTNMVSSGFSYFNDPKWTNYPTRFYRIRSP